MSFERIKWKSLSMKSNFLSSLVCIFFVQWLICCSKKESSSAEHFTSVAPTCSEEATSGKTISPECYKEKAKKASASTGSAVPTFSEANIKNINVPIIKSLKSTTTKIFWVTTTSFYRAIWLDVQSGGFMRLPPGDARGADLRDVIKGITEPSQASAHQPIPPPVRVGETMITFSILGHAFTPAIEAPTFGTAVLSSSGVDQQGPVAPPDNYKLVYEHVGVDLNEILKECASPEGAESARMQNKCGKYQQYTRSGSLKIQDLFNKKNVAIWKPVPPEGYKCLGYLATNGQNQKPYTNFDSSGEYVEQGMDYAMYCVQDKYVVEGKLSKPVLTLPYLSKGISFFATIVPKDDKGYGANLFHVVNVEDKDNLASVFEKEKVYVLNKDFIEILNADGSTQEQASPSPK